MTLSTYGKLVKDGIINGDIEEISSNWSEMSDSDKNEISFILSKINKKDKEELYKRISIINEYIGKGLYQLMTLNTTEENELDEESYNEEDFIDEENWIYIIEQKAKMLGLFAKELKNNGIKDKETIKQLLIEELRNGINK
jgi:hypothetical protein